MSLFNLALLQAEKSWIFCSLVCGLRRTGQVLASHKELYKKTLLSQLKLKPFCNPSARSHDDFSIMKTTSHYLILNQSWYLLYSLRDCCSMFWRVRLYETWILWDLNWYLSPIHSHHHWNEQFIFFIWISTWRGNRCYSLVLQFYWIAKFIGNMP